METTEDSPTCNSLVVRSNTFKPVLLDFIYHNSLILIFESIIRVVLNYTQHGRVSPTPEESVGALDPHHRLNMCMDGDDRR
jgi:hypothetical protein